MLSLPAVPPQRRESEKWYDAHIMVYDFLQEQISSTATNYPPHDDVWNDGRDSSSVIAVTSARLRRLTSSMAANRLHSENCPAF